MQQQQLIELIRENNVEGAVEFASNHLAERGEEDPVVLHELERTMALLAFENPLNSPFADLLAPSHRQKVVVVLLCPRSKFMRNLDALFIRHFCRWPAS